jgi:hypothetical protein
MCIRTTILQCWPYPPLHLWGRVHSGDSAGIAIAEPVGITVPATVTYVDQVFDTASGIFGVRLELPNPDDALPAGLRCRPPAFPDGGNPRGIHVAPHFDEG